MYLSQLGRYEINVVLLLLTVVVVAVVNYINMRHKIKQHQWLWQQCSIRTYKEQNRKMKEWITLLESGKHVDGQWH